MAQYNVIIETPTYTVVFYRVHFKKEFTFDSIRDPLGNLFTYQKIEDGYNLDAYIPDNCDIFDPYDWFIDGEWVEIFESDREIEGLGECVDATPEDLEPYMDKFEYIDHLFYPVEPGKTGVAYDRLETMDMIYFKTVKFTNDPHSIYLQWKNHSVEIGLFLREPHGIKTNILVKKINFINTKNKKHIMYPCITWFLSPINHSHVEMYSFQKGIDYEI